MLLKFYLYQVGTLFKTQDPDKSALKQPFANMPAAAAAIAAIPPTAPGAAARWHIDTIGRWSCAKKDVVENAGGEEVFHMRIMLAEGEDGDLRGRQGPHCVLRAQ